jgi:hypothetical protein
MEEDMDDVKRDEQLSRWVRAAPEHERQEWAGVLMWGVWLSPDNEDCPSPDALFGTRPAAEEWVKSVNPRECDISPCVVWVISRNSFDVPSEERTPAESSSP